MEKDLERIYLKWHNALLFNSIEFILNDTKRNRIIVKFSDGHKRIVSMQKGDHFDKYVGVSLALAKELCGSTTKLYKLVDDKIALGDKVLKNNSRAKNKKEKNNYGRNRKNCI